MNEFLLILFCCGASFIQRVTGFGFGIFIMTILPFLMPSYGEATTLSGLLAIALSFSVMVKYRKYIVWHKIIPILISFLLFSLISIQFVTYVEDSILKQLLGGTLILLSIYFFFFSEKLHIQPTLTAQIGMGSISGIMGGLFAMQGPPAVLYFIAAENDKEKYMAMTQTYFLFGNIFMSIVRAINGYLTFAVAQGWLYACIGIVIGGFIGNKVFEKMQTKTLRKIVYGYMAISGIVAILST